MGVGISFTKIFIWFCWCCMWWWGLRQTEIKLQNKVHKNIKKVMIWFVPCLRFLKVQCMWSGFFWLGNWHFLLTSLFYQGHLMADTQNQNRKYQSSVVSMKRCIHWTEHLLSHAQVTLTKPTKTKLVLFECILLQNVWSKIPLARFAAFFCFFQNK